MGKYYVYRGPGVRQASIYASGECIASYHGGQYFVHPDHHEAFCAVKQIAVALSEGSLQLFSEPEDLVAPATEEYLSESRFTGE